MSTLIYKKTYACPNCQFKPDQTYDPNSQAWYDATFPQPWFAGCPLGDCPACYAGLNPQGQKMVSHMEVFSGVDLGVSLNQSLVADDTILESTQVEVVDPVTGRPQMVKIGSHFEPYCDPVTGVISSIQVDDFAPQTRSLTTDELTALKQQRDQNLNALSSVNVKEQTV